MLKSSLCVSGFSLLVQFVGFLKLLLIANYFGVSPQLDGYYIALVIPGLLLGFIGGALQTGFMPVYGKLLTNHNLHGALQFRSSILWLSVTLLAGICMFLFCLADVLMGLLVPQASAPIEIFAVYSFRILVFSLMLNALADYFALVLNAHHRFYSAAAAPLVNIIIATAILYHRPEWGLNSLIWGLVLGLMAQIMVVVTVLIKHRINFEFIIAIDSPTIHRAWKLMRPILPGIALANANISVDQAVAAIAGDGAVSIIGYASRFHNVITQAGIVSISVVLLPTLIRLVAINDTQTILNLLGKVFKWIGIASLLLMVVVWSAGEYLLELLLARGQFGIDDVENVYNVWVWYTLGLFPMAAGVFYSKLFLAWEMPIVLTQFALVSFTLNLVLNFILIRYYGIVGIAMATTAVYCVTTVLFYRKARCHRYPIGLET